MMDDVRSAADSPWIDSGSQEDALIGVRVLIVGVGTLLDFSIITLLTDKPELLVADVTYRGEDELLQKVTDFQPDVILICESGEFRASTVTDLLRHHGVIPCCKVIVARLDSNTLDIYERVTIAHRDELLTVIRKVDRQSRFE